MRGFDNKACAGGESERGKLTLEDFSVVWKNRATAPGAEERARRGRKNRLPRFSAQSRFARVKAPLRREPFRIRLRSLTQAL
jgi:hypothetical protein